MTKIKVVGILLIEENFQTTVLMIQQNNTWEFPYGMKDDNESTEDSIKRHMKTHTDLDVLGTPTLYGVFPDDYDANVECHAYLIEAEGVVSTSKLYTDKQFVNVFFNQEYITSNSNRFILEDLKNE